MPQLDPMLPPTQTFTTWENPFDRDVVLDLHIGASATNKSGRVRYIVPAKGSTNIPSEFDMGIQDVRDGQVVGGLGPQLIRRDQSNSLAPALDTDRAKALEAQADAARAFMLKKAADDALVVAVAKNNELAATAAASAPAPQAPAPATSKKG